MTDQSSRQALPSYESQDSVLHEIREVLERHGCDVAKDDQGLITGVGLALIKREDLLREVLGWIDNWDPNFTDDPEWPEVAGRVRALVNPKQVGCDD